MSCKFFSFKYGCYRLETWDCKITPFFPIRNKKLLTIYSKNMEPQGIFNWLEVEVELEADAVAVGAGVVAIG